jgi:hypothetical protein
MRGIVKMVAARKKLLLQFSKGVENLTPTTFNLTTLQAVDGRAL